MEAIRVRRVPTSEELTKPVDYVLIQKREPRVTVERQSLLLPPSLLKRLRLHGLLKKVGRTYKYYLTAFGKEVITAGLRLKELFLVPELALGYAQ